MLDAAIADLARSGISEQEAERAGLWSVSNAKAEIYQDFESKPAIVIPYFEPDGKTLMTFDRSGISEPFCRIRYLEVAQSKGFAGRKSAPRYGQPGASGTRVYFPPTYDWSPIVNDIQTPIIITEGEKKALAGCAAGFPVVALGGVFNFAVSGNGELLEDLTRIKWPRREFFICLDSDAVLNPQIQMAEARLIYELQTKLGARARIVRLPPDGDNKVGMDDFLLSHGPEALEALMLKSESLGALDARVISLNRSVAWIEKEGAIFDLENREFISKDNFVSGSRYSALKYIVLGSGQRSAPKEISIAQKFLTHPHAQRYGESLFRPGEGAVTMSDKGKPALNMFYGWRAEHGVPATDKRISAFLELTRFLFQNMEEKDRDLPFKLLAYKAQHPMAKVPLALCLIGRQGCGKSLWGECIIHAFNPYSVSFLSSTFGGDFQGWMETSLFALVNEAEAMHMLKYGEKLKSLISDKSQFMNEKFRPARMVDTYTLYMLTANDHAVGSFSGDDRRMIVVDCPPPMLDAEGQALYRYLGATYGRWIADGGPQALMGYLLDYELGGWQPPPVAPQTAEKQIAYEESLSLVQELARDIEKSTDHTIEQWMRAGLKWAEEAVISNNPAWQARARATLEGVKHLQLRPWYTAREISLLFPFMGDAVLGRSKGSSTPGELSRDLRNAGVKFLRNKDNPGGFVHRGKREQYLLIADADEWVAGITQAEFDRYMAGFGTFGGVR